MGRMIEHIEEGYDCWCNPTVRLLHSKNLVVHHEVVLARTGGEVCTMKEWDGTTDCFEEMCMWFGEDSEPRRNKKNELEFFGGTCAVGDWVVRGRDLGFRAMTRKEVLEKCQFLDEVP